MHNILLMVLINKILDFTNNRLLVGQTCDVIKFTHLIFQINEHISMSEFETHIKNGQFIVNIGGSNTLNSISLYSKMSPIICYDNCYIVKIPFESTWNEILLCQLQYHDVRLELHRIDYLFNNISVMTEQKFLNESRLNTIQGRETNNLNTQIIDDIINSSYERSYQGLTLDDIECIAHHDNRHRLNFNHIVKGFFIECMDCDINNINGFALILNGTTRFEYDKHVLQTVGHKLSDKLIYISLTNKITYETNSFDSFVNGLNCSRIDSIVCKLPVNESCNLRLYAVNMDIAQYAGNMFCFKFVN